MIVSWDFYIRRKRLDINGWLASKNINSYSELVSVTKKLGIEPPPEESMSEYFKKPEINKNDKKIKKPTAKRVTKPTPKKATTTTKRTTKSTSRRSKRVASTSETTTENIQSVEEVSKQEEKPKRKRRTRKKRQPVKKEN